MGERSTISGHIQETFYVPDGLEQKLLEANTRTVQSLPSIFRRERVGGSSTSEPWLNWLTADMFSFSVVRPAGQPIGEQRWPSYRGRTIFFSVTLSKMWDPWDEWLAEFESLLERLFWEHAAVVMVNEWMPNAVCLWHAELLDIPEDGSQPRPPRIGRFEGPRRLEDIPADPD